MSEEHLPRSLFGEMSAFGISIDVVEDTIGRRLEGEGE